MGCCKEKRSVDWHRRSPSSVCGLAKGISFADALAGCTHWPRAIPNADGDELSNPTSPFEKSQTPKNMGAAPAGGILASPLRGDPSRANEPLGLTKQLGVPESPPGRAA